MSSYPYMPLFVGDYLGDTAHLTTLEHGAYLLLIMAEWQSGKALPAANGRLANVARLSSDEWMQVEPSLRPFFNVDGSSWSHPRVQRELIKVREKSEKNRAAGKVSGQRRSSRRQTGAERSFNHTESDSEIDIGEDSPPPPSVQSYAGERAADEQSGEKSGTSGAASADGDCQVIPVAGSRSSETASPESSPDEIPRGRAVWVAALRTDAVHSEIVDRLIAPLLATLTVPPDVSPIAWLRLWRDAAAALDMPPRLMAEVARRVAVDRVRDLPWPKDLPKIVDEVRARLQLTLPAGDPRWAAWLARDLRDSDRSAFARAVQRNRWSYQAEAPWPPDTPPPEVEQLPLGAWRIAHGTPEHAAWLTVLRRRDPAAAQSAEVNKRDLTESTRWPPLGGAAAACMTASHRGQRETTGPASHAARCAR